MKRVTISLIALSAIASVFAIGWWRLSHRSTSEVIVRQCPFVVDWAECEGVRQDLSLPLRLPVTRAKLKVQISSPSIIKFASGGSIKFVSGKECLQSTTYHKVKKSTNKKSGETIAILQFDWLPPSDLRTETSAILQIRDQGRTCAEMSCLLPITKN